MLASQAKEAGPTPVFRSILREAKNALRSLGEEGRRDRWQTKDYKNKIHYV